MAHLICTRSSLGVLFQMKVTVRKIIITEMYNKQIKLN